MHDGAIRSLNYTSHPEITISDHKPVSSLLRLRVCHCILRRGPKLMASRSQILTIIPEKRLVVTQEVMEKREQFVLGVSPHGCMLMFLSSNEVDSYDK